MLNKLNFIPNKKAEIGETLTWFVAFLLIFFIMVLFTVTCMAIATGKGFTRDKGYTAQPISGDILNTEKVIFILDTNTSKGFIKDLIISWSKEVDKEKKKNLEIFIKSYLEEALQKQNVTIPCYDLMVSQTSPQISLFYVSNIQLGSAPIPGGSVATQTRASSALKNVIYLSNGQEYITIKFYGGAC